jgi:hypothetical protein
MDIMIEGKDDDGYRIQTTETIARILIWAGKFFKRPYCYIFEMNNL